MQVAEEKKNIIMDDNIPAGLDRLDLILEADANKRVIAERREAPRLEDGVLKERLNNIDAMMAYIMNELDDLDADLGVEDSEAYEDPDPYAAEALGDEDIDDPLADGHPDYEDPDAVEVVNADGVDHLNDDPYADIEIPPPEGWDPDFDGDFPEPLDEDLPALPNGLIDNREQWRDINRYQNYEVSHHGRVRNKTTGRILRLQPNGTGYLRAALYSRGVRSQICVHKLVAEAWLPNPDEKPEVDHIDGNTENNMMHNLRWCTRAENMQNRGMFRNNTTGYKGVSRARGGRFRARITANKQHIYLGLFDTAEEAAAAYRAAAPVHHRAYANPQGLRP